MKVNDDTTMNDIERESELTVLAATMGVEMSFEG